MQNFADEIDWTASEDTNIGPVPTMDITEECAPVAAPVSTFEAPVMNETARDLANQESAVLKTLGIGASEQLFETGTALAQSGHDALQTYDREYNALPTVKTALEGFQATITAEQRRDAIRDLADYRIDADGKLAHVGKVAGGSGFALEPTAWRQLAQIAATQNINAGLSKRTRADRRVRIRGEGSVFAIVSADPKRGYAVCDGPEVASYVERGLRDANMLDGSKCELKYDPESTRYKIRTVLQAPIEIAAHRGVGRVHRVFMDVSGGDNGETSIRGAMGALRIRCLNATLSQADGMTWHRRHVGDANQVRALVADMARQWSVVAREIQALWTKAGAEYYLSPEGGRLDAPEAIRRLVAHGYVPTGGLSKEDATDAYLQAWGEEEGVHSTAGVIMAIQRAAHETTWKTKWSTEEIEEAASGLLYQNVYQLREVDA
jgi:hypothetical protein